jgi:hypothetical protein
MLQVHIHSQIFTNIVNLRYLCIIRYYLFSSLVEEYISLLIQSCIHRSFTDLTIIAVIPLSIWSLHITIVMSWFSRDTLMNHYTIQIIEMISLTIISRNMFSYFRISNIIYILWSILLNTKWVWVLYWYSNLVPCIVEPFQMNDDDVRAFFNSESLLGIVLLLTRGA